MTKVHKSIRAVERKRAQEALENWQKEMHERQPNRIPKHWRDEVKEENETLLKNMRKEWDKINASDLPESEKRKKRRDAEWFQKDEDHYNRAAMYGELKRRKGQRPKDAYKRDPDAPKLRRNETIEK